MLDYETLEKQLYNMPTSMLTVGLLARQRP